MITVIDSPYRYAPVGQKLMFVVSSTNSANSGFRYVFTINGVTIYVQPNPNGIGMLDIEPIIREQVGHQWDSTLSSMYTEAMYQVSDVTVQEGWLVDGVFNPTIGDGTTISEMYFFKGSEDLSNGFKPNPSTRYGMNGSTKYLMSELNFHTFEHKKPSWAGALDVYHESYLSDWGIVYFPSATARLTNTIEQFSIEQLDIDGNVLSLDTIPISNENTHTYLFGIYPQNVMLGFIWNANTKYIRYKLIDYIGGNASFTYLLGIIDDECKFDKIRLQWDNQVGGYDYWNFTKKSELTYNYERKQYTKPLGTYGSSTFSFNTSDRMLTDRKVNTTKGLVINTDWLTKAQYEFLNSLLRSDNVNIVNSDGSHTPVIIDANTLTIPDSRYSKLYQLTLNVKYSQPLSI